MSLAVLDRIRRDDRLAALLRIGLGAVFLYAGALKAFAPLNLAGDIANYHLVPAAWVPLFAVTLPWVEILTGLALLVGWFGRGAALVAGALMAAFTVALSQALLRGIDLACGCFGGTDPATGWTVLRDVVLLAVALHVAAFDTGRLGLGRRLLARPPRETPLHG
jgi:putative oxidoreductase